MIINEESESFDMDIANAAGHERRQIEQIPSVCEGIKTEDLSVYDEELPF